MQMDKTEYDLKAYEARLGVWKTVLTTLIGGFAVTSVTALIDCGVKTREREQREFEGRRAFIEKFVDRAMNGDIEARERMARYLATVLPQPGENASADVVRWKRYLEIVEGERRHAREEEVKMDELTEARRVAEEKLQKLREESEKIEREKAQAAAAERSKFETKLAIARKRVEQQELELQKKQMEIGRQSEVLEEAIRKTVPVAISQPVVTLTKLVAHDLQSTGGKCDKISIETALGRSVWGPTEVCKGVEIAIHVELPVGTTWFRLVEHDFWANDLFEKVWVDRPSGDSGVFRVRGSSSSRTWDYAVHYAIANR